MLSVLVLVLVGTILKFDKGLVYASNLTVTKNEIYTSDNSYISKSEYGLNIFPQNYNQGTTYNCTSDDVVIDKNGNIYVSSISENITITIFAKSSNTSTIFETITLKPLKNSNSDLQIEKNSIIIYENQIEYNILTYPLNSSVSIKSKNNLVIYDYITGLITLNKNNCLNPLYDKITITITTNNSIQSLSFDGQSPISRYQSPSLFGDWAPIPMFLILYIHHRQE